MIRAFVWSACVLAAISVEAKERKDSCEPYNQGTSVRRIRLGEAYKDDWAYAVKEAEKAIDALRMPSIANWEYDAPSQFDSVERKVRAMIDPHIEKAGTCFETSLFAEIWHGLAEKLEKYRPSATAVAAWNEKLRREALDEARKRERVTAFEQFAVNGGTVVVPNHSRITLLEAAAVGKASTRVSFQIENISEGRIIRPRTARVYGFDADSPHHGGRLPTGFSLTDNFANDFPLQNVSRELFGSESGMQPGAAGEISLEFSGIPPEKAKAMIFRIGPGTLDNAKPIEIRIPRELITESLN